MTNFGSIAAARQTMKGSFIGKVISAGDLKSGTTDDGKDWTNKQFRIEDSSGKITLTAWGEEIKLFEVGKTYEFTTPWWRNYNNETVLALGKFAKVKMVDAISPSTTAAASPEPQPAAAAPPAAAQPAAPTSTSTATLGKIDIDTHNQCWAFAVREATQVYPEKFRGGNLSSGEELRTDLNLKDRMILAMVFYKKNMDAIHHQKL